MSSSSSQSIVAESRTGSLNYLDGTVQHSLYRNGKVLIRRDSDGNDEDGTGVSVERRKAENPLVDLLLAKPVIAPRPGSLRVVYGSH